MYEYKAKLERVVDGDTIDVLIDLGFKVFKQARLRLSYVDTPEIHGVKKNSEEWTNGMKAKAIVEDWFGRVEPDIIVRTNKDKTGKYGRWIAEVFGVSPEGMENLNMELVDMGYGEGE